MSVGDALLLFLPDMLATFVGAALGLSSAMWWDRRKDAQEREDRRLQTVGSILGEVEVIEQVCQGVLEEPDGGSPAAEARPSEAPADPPHPDEGVTVEIGIFYLPASAFETAVHSGGLALLPTALQVGLSKFYELVRLTRLHIDNAATSYARALEVAENVTFLDNARLYLRIHCEQVLGQIEEIRPQLRHELGPAEREPRATGGGDAGRAASRA